MANKWQALQSFWASFGLPAYDENTVPDDAEMPYITFEGRTDSFGTPVASSAQIWYRSKSWMEISQKELYVEERISRGGRMVDYDGGAFWIKRGTPWAMRMDDETDDSIRRIVLNTEIEFID